MKCYILEKDLNKQGEIRTLCDLKLSFPQVPSSMRVGIFTPIWLNFLGAFLLTFVIQSVGPSLSP